MICLFGVIVLQNSKIKMDKCDFCIMLLSMFSCIFSGFIVGVRDMASYFHDDSLTSVSVFTT